MDDFARASSALVPIASEKLNSRQAFALPPGPALDDYLRREVLGDTSNGPTLPYSTDALAVLILEDALAARGWELHVAFDMHPDGGRRFHAEFWRPDWINIEPVARHSTLAESICKAACLAHSLRDTAHAGLREGDRVIWVNAPARPRYTWHLTEPLFEMLDEPHGLISYGRGRSEIVPANELEKAS